MKTSLLPKVIFLEKINTETGNKRTAVRNSENGTVQLQLCLGSEHQKYGQLSQLSIRYSYDSIRQAV
jgi:hypothetical protein